MSGGLFNKFLNLVGLEDVEQDSYEDYDENDYPHDEFNDSGYAENEELDDYSKKDKKNKSKVVGMPTSLANSKMKVVVYQPNSNEDTQDIIDNLKLRKPVIINLDDLDIEVAQRALDFISGAVYALNANIQKVARSIYVITPNGVDIATNNEDEIHEGHSIRSARR